MARRHSGWMAMVLVALLVAACGGGAETAPTAAAEEAPAAAPSPQEMTPAELGQAIGTVYVEAMNDVVAAMEGRPPAAEVEPEIAEIQESAVSRLVELGRAREALPPADRATVDAKVRSAVRGLPSETFTAYAEGQNHYLASDRELADLIASFNVLTQYANFDLLKKQEPKEAERLGIQ